MAMCDGKRRYETQTEAVCVAAKMIVRGLARTMLPYQCTNCGGWHLTSKRAQVASERKREVTLW